MIGAGVTIGKGAVVHGIPLSCRELVIGQSAMVDQSDHCGRYYMSVRGVVSWAWESTRPVNTNRKVYQFDLVTIGEHSSDSGLM
ncbi:MAG: hypothetical protein ACLUD2_02485 [Clostridium sp.]